MTRPIYSHGTAGYRAGCRCDECKAARSAVDHVQRRLRKEAKGIVTSPRPLRYGLVDHRWSNSLPADATREDRFWAKVWGGAVDECWEWLAARDREGYGRFGIQGRRLVRAHRFAYEQMVGEIPEGLQLDHLCRMPACVNPWHLEPVTAAENIRRKRNPPGLARTG